MGEWGWVGDPCDFSVSPVIIWDWAWAVWRQGLIKLKKERFEIVFWSQSTFGKLNEFLHKYDINHLVGLCGILCASLFNTKIPSRYHHLHLMLSVLQITKEKFFELSIFHCHISDQSIREEHPELTSPRPSSSPSQIQNERGPWPLGCH